MNYKQLLQIKKKKKKQEAKKSRQTGFLNQRLEAPAASRDVTI